MLKKNEKKSSKKVTNIIGENYYYNESPKIKKKYIIFCLLLKSEVRIFLVIQIFEKS